MRSEPVTHKSSIRSAGRPRLRRASLRPPAARLIATALALVGVAVGAALLVAWRGGQDKPLALSGRVWESGEAPGAGLPAKRQTVSDVATFVDQIEDSLVRATAGEAEQILSHASTSARST
jgi:hypothetical protein